MKKTLSILVLFLGFIFLINFVEASEESILTLTNLDINTNKTIVKPNEEIDLNIEFGENLNSYNFEILYDKNLLEFVSTDRGNITDTGTKIIVSYEDETTSITNIKLVFKGKNNIITSNPTNFAITANSLKKGNMQQYKDIAVPIIKNLIVEPEYDDYKINLEYSGEITKNVEKDMTLSISSTMGRPYEHARIIIETVKPTGGSVKLLGYDEFGLEHDMIQSGWGDASGYPMGGENIKKILNLRGTFYTEGEYTITVKMVNRENSDSIISQKSFSIVVKEDENLSIGNSTSNSLSSVGSMNAQNQNNTIKSETLLKTGSDNYIGIIIFTLIIILGYLYLENKRKDNL